jgi:molybdopterin-guanine dinucleotide biosynthesis protein A
MTSRSPTNPMPTLCAAILAGGQASRYGGRPKGLLELPGGASMIERVIGATAGAGIDDVIIVANDVAAYRGPGRPVIPDIREGLGPLAGIEAALEHYGRRCDGVLVLPCDLPAITAKEVAALTAAFATDLPPVVVAETEDGLRHPLCAVVRADVLAPVKHALDAGKLGVHHLWREVGAVPVVFPDPHPFLNINTPGGMEQWLAGREAAE